MDKKVIVSGACGRMGQQVVETVVKETEAKLVGAFDKKNVGQNILNIVGLDGREILISDNLDKLIEDTEADTIIDFTSPQVVMDNIRTGLTNDVHMIVGTTGISDDDLKEIQELTGTSKANALIVPNFAIGAVLLMQFSQQAAKYFDDVEIIELHHDQKMDAPSGTSIKTAELIQENLKNKKQDQEKTYIENLEGVRGGKKGDIHIHSVRLPGLVAHQEVIFGGESQSLTLRHDSFARKSFMPGVKLALQKIEELDDMVYGLEKVMDL